MPDHSPIIGPVIAMVAWTLVMWAWMYATRLPAMRRAGIDGARMVGGTGPALRDALMAKGEQRASWVADNYNHLHEQPTVFYAVAIALALLGHGGGLNLQIAWAYVGLRVAHSIVQATVNRVAIRFALFALSSLCLIALTLHAAIAHFHGHHG